MELSELDYELPEERIAQEALPRGSSRLLVLDALGAERNRRISDLPELLEPGDVLVVNDTRVIPARLFARRAATGARVELLLLEQLGPTEWEALARPAKKARRGTVLSLDPLSAEVVEEGKEGRRRLVFSEPLEPHLDRLGHVPLPPYIRRPDEAADRERYQTIFALHPGAVAAPTAGLHFTPDLLRDLEGLGVEIHPVTLHVGIGTFRPVSVDRLEDHRMDSERYHVPPETADAVAKARSSGGRVVAVGTTVVRTLETAAAVARERGEAGVVAAGAGRSELFITPGYRFRAVDALVTNFHLPRSTLLALVCALAGRERVLAAYREAVDEGYRFYSYGDAMFLTRRP